MSEDIKVNQRTFTHLGVDQGFAILNISQSVALDKGSQN